MYTVSLYTRDRDCTLFEAREERLLGLLRRQRVILRLADALIVMDSRLVIRVEKMVTTSSLFRGFRSGPERRYMYMYMYEYLFAVGFADLLSLFLVV